MTTQEKDQLRADCQEDISRTGKFESEPIFSPYFYAQSLESNGETLIWPDETTTIVIQVLAEDRELFPELDSDTVAVTITESESGFVYCEELTHSQLNELNGSYDNAWENSEIENEP